MADPTTSQDTAKRREITKGLLGLCCDRARTRFKSEEFQEAIKDAERALKYCDELGDEGEAQKMHHILCFSYISLIDEFQLEGRSSQGAVSLENAKLALKHCEQLEDKESRRSAYRSIASIFVKLKDFGEALIIGEKWMSYFEENEDTEEKHDAQWTMTSAYYGRALNYLNNKQFKEALDDGEQALVYYKDDESLTIQIRWLLVRAYFSQEDFENALEQFDSEPEMFSSELELDVEDYIKAGRVHKEMCRYDEALNYLKEAKKVANNRDLKRKVNRLIEEVNKLKEKANESMKKDDIPPTLKDIGEIGIENKKEIEEEQTFCHTGENIEKEVSGDEGGPHTEDITKEDCEVLDAKRTPSFEKKNIKWMVTNNQGRWEEKEIICSVLKVENEKTATHHQYISYILGEAAVKVHSVDQCFIVLDEITSCFIDWYTTIYDSYTGDRNRKVDWWNHIENSLRRLFRGVIKSISKLHPNHFHGNLIRGIAVVDEEAKLFNMKPCGIEGYTKDINNLYYMITNVVDGVHPDQFFDGLDDGYTKEIANLYCSKEFTIFLNCLEYRKDDEMVDIYHPFFWPEYEQMYFLERVFDLFWKDFKIMEKRNHWNELMKLEHCFSRQWEWVNYLPSVGAFHEVYNYYQGPPWQMAHIPKAYAIAFWRHCKTHYNDYLVVGEKRKIVEEIHDAVNKRFNILSNVFLAVCMYIEKFHEATENRAIYDKLVTLKNMPAMWK